jgi:hypothetical protein
LLNVNQSMCQLNSKRGSCIRKNDVVPSNMSRMFEIKVNVSILVTDTISRYPLVIG